MPKLEAHEKRFASGFSVFVLNSKMKLLQQRAHQNTILPLFGPIPVAVIKGRETNIQAGSRRL
jgi:hypothetical protein